MGITIKSEVNEILGEVEPIRVSGNLALHQEMNWQEKTPVRGQYRITHIPTGAAIFVPIKNKKNALKLFNAVLRASMDWSFTSPKSKKIKAQANKWREVRDKFRGVLEY